MQGPKSVTVGRARNNPIITMYLKINQTHGKFITTIARHVKTYKFSFSTFPVKQWLPEQTSIGHQSYTEQPWGETKAQASCVDGLDLW